MALVMVAIQSEASSIPSQSTQACTPALSSASFSFWTNGLSLREYEMKTLPLAPCDGSAMMFPNPLASDEPGSDNPFGARGVFHFEPLIVHADLRFCVRFQHDELRAER